MTFRSAETHTTLLDWNGFWRAIFIWMVLNLCNNFPLIDQQQLHINCMPTFLCECVKLFLFTLDIHLWWHMNRCLGQRRPPNIQTECTSGRHTMFLRAHVNIHSRFTAGKKRTLRDKIKNMTHLFGARTIYWLS